MTFPLTDISEWALYEGLPALVDSSTRSHAGYTVHLALDDAYAACDLSVYEDGILVATASGLDPSYLGRSAGTIVTEFVEGQPRGKTILRQNRPHFRRVFGNASGTTPAE